MEIPANNTRRSLAIAASLFGLIGLLELGWMLMENIKAGPCVRLLTEPYFSIPSLLGFTLSLITTIKYNSEGPLLLTGDVQTAIWPAGKRLAIFGVIASAPGLFLTIASLPSCGFHHEPCRETTTINILRTIHQDQATYYATCSRFATLEELAAFGLMDSEYASGRQVYGYIYSSSDVTAETYCAHADRANDKCGQRDFIVCEDGIIRYAESKVRGAVKRDEGTPLSEAGGAGLGGQFQK